MKDKIILVKVKGHCFMEHCDLSGHDGCGCILPDSFGECSDGYLYKFKEEVNHEIKKNPHK